MSSFLQPLLAFIFALGVLIIFHEVGHFLAARCFNVKILRFSVGFGRLIWKRTFGADATEFAVSALPLGGYVKMLDEREGVVAPAERGRAFNRQSVLRRIVIVVAGPAFNFLFAICAYWMMYMAGITGLRPVVDGVIQGSPSQAAGVLPGDRIVAVDGDPTPTWASFLDVAVGKVVGGGKLELTVSGEDGHPRIIRLDVSRIRVDDLANGQLVDRLGMEPRRPVIPAVAGKVVAGGAAERAGLRPGDRITAVDGKPVKGWEQLVEIIRRNPGSALAVTVTRGGSQVSLRITPDAVSTDDGKTVGHIGAVVDTRGAMDPDLVGRERYWPGKALVKAVARTVEMSAITLRVLGKMIVGQASIRNLSGPISIAQYAGESASIGLIAFAGFLAVVSVSLGVLNLLPIPLLDGGHLMYYLIEAVKGSPVSESVQAVGQQVGLAVLLCLMGLALYNDILRLVG